MSSSAEVLVTDCIVVSEFCEPMDTRCPWRTFQLKAGSVLHGIVSREVKRRRNCTLVYLSGETVTASLWVCVLRIFVRINFWLLILFSTYPLFNYYHVQCLTQTFYSTN